MMALWRTCETISELRLVRVARKRWNDAPVEVVDHGHAGPRGSEERRHHHDARRQELDVGVDSKPGRSTIRRKSWL